MRIDEIKVTPYDYQINRKQTSNYSYSYEGRFKTKDGSIVVVNFKCSDEYAYIQFSRDDKYLVTNQGDQFRILFTVMEIIEKILSIALKEDDFNELSFSASVSEPSRVKLYTNKVAPRISQILGPNWSGPKITKTSLATEYTWILDKK